MFKFNRLVFLGVGGALLLGAGDVRQAHADPVSCGLLFASQEDFPFVTSPAVNDSGEIVFQDNGFVGTIRSSTRGPLVAAGDTIDGKTLTAVQHATVNDSGDVVFRGQFPAGIGSETAIFLVPAVGSPSRIAKKGDVVDGETVDVPWLSAINDSGVVVYMAVVDCCTPLRTAIIKLDPTAADTILVKTGDVVDGITLVRVEHPAINDAGDVVFRGTSGSGIFGSDPGIFLIPANGDPPSLVVAQDDVIGGITVRSPSMPSINDSQEVVFTGFLDVGQSVLFTLNNIIVKTGDMIGELELGQIGRASIDDDGDIVFESATLNGGLTQFRGIFALKPPEAVVGLILDLINEVTLLNLQNGIENAFDSKLENVIASLDAANAGQRNDAANKLDAFINAVEAQRGNALSDTEADNLIAKATEILSCL